MKLFVIEEGAVRAIERAAKRLYTENRMNGDEMRDLAQMLDRIARRSREVEIPEDY